MKAVLATLVLALLGAVVAAAEPVTPPKSPPTTLTIGGQNYSVVRQADPNARLPSFNKDLAFRHLPPVESCTLLIDLPVGFARSNHSFGAVCLQKHGSKTAKIMICNDEMIGHFATQLAGKDTVTQEDLARYVAAQCYGG